MKRKLLSILIIVAFALGALAQKRVMFDLSHGQFKDVFVEPSYYDYVIPGYEEIANRENFTIVKNYAEITSESLREIDVLLVLSPLAKSTQKDFTVDEKEAIVEYIKKGGSVILFIDEEEYRVNLTKYGVNDITSKFGIEVKGDFEAPGNCGAVTFVNEIFSQRLEIPCSGQRSIVGGIPASVCLEGGYQLSSYVHLKNGGKLYVAGETMVALLMGLPDGDRNEHHGMQTRWWGKDSRQYMSELLQWALKK